MKEVRETLIKLAKYGAIGSQEVPRTSDHIPSKTWYLWRYNERQMLKNVKTHIIHSLRNLYEVIQAEYSNNALLIAKTQRLDVKENPSLLGAGERESLKVLFSVLNKLEFLYLSIVEEMFLLN